jgi:hypothetical protein
MTKGAGKIQMSDARYARTRGFGWAAVALLACAAAAGARAAQAGGAQPRAGEQGTQPTAARTAPPPLSKEDAALVKEMVLLERVELLRNLELFERGADEQASADGAAGPEGG